MIILFNIYIEIKKLLLRIHIKLYNIIIVLGYYISFLYKNWLKMYKKKV